MSYNSGPSNETLEKSAEIYDPRIPIRRKLQIQIEKVEKQLAEMKEALTALDANPEFEKLHDILTRVSRHL